MIRIEAIAAFSDNYIWLLYDSGKAVVVDPGDAAPVQRALAERGLELEAVLVTHHHADHIGGIRQLIDGSDIPVIGPASEHIRQVTQPLRDGDRVQVLGADFKVIAVPGHTLDHIALYSENAGEQPVLFCGDTLFAGGCGRIFEGNPQMMQASLSRLADLPGNTLVYCAHEYTLANLNFALAVEPGNNDLQQRMRDAQALRARNTPTVPSTIALEQGTNPFLRCHLPSLKTSAESHCGQPCRDNLQVFATVRSWKDNF